MGSTVNGGVGGVGRAGRAPDPRIVHVVEVVDGDTLRVRFVSGTVRTMRHVGIDAPARARCLGERAVREHGRLAPRGSRLRLEFDAVRRDDAGVLLAHAYRVADGEIVGARLLEAGAARVRTIAPNVRHVQRLNAAAVAAREARRGVWRACAAGA